MVFFKKRLYSGQGRMLKDGLFPSIYLSITCSIFPACVVDVLSVHSLDISQPSHLLDLSISTPLSLEVQVECTQVPSLCPTAPADPNQVHFTFQIKVS